MRSMAKYIVIMVLVKHRLSILLISLVKYMLLRRIRRLQRTRRQLGYMMRIELRVMNTGMTEPT